MYGCKQTVALTFDDAPDPTNTARVLDDLANAGVKATFFVNTNNQMNVASSSQAQVHMSEIRHCVHLCMHPSIMSINCHAGAYFIIYCMFRRRS
jgi:peptidoglycan/xylan/chitin deacetylase (PgdA/CDA1 family)